MRMPLWPSRSGQAPWRRGALLPVLAAVFSLTGCMSFTKAYKTATRENLYDYADAYYLKVCGDDPAKATRNVIPSCWVMWDHKHSLRLANDAAAKALKWGGSWPYQYADMVSAAEKVDADIKKWKVNGY